jgi:ABC-type glutathione transport system ATPase component
MPLEPIACARGLVKRYTGRRGTVVTALDGVDFDIAAGSAVALVGESGSGKSTLARCLAGFETPDAGEIRLHASVQMVFQDAAGTLNPGMRAAGIVAEPLAVQKRGSARERRLRALELMQQVGLAPGAADRRPREFSGGQRQRLAIARALAAAPRLLILDEALSGLDASIQAQIANLLAGLQARLGLSYLFITHDLALACAVAGEIAVMDAGRIVERASPALLLAAPRHTHTRGLIAAVPELPCAI